jgi:hypothetical protein
VGKNRRNPGSVLIWKNSPKKVGVSSIKAAKKISEKTEKSIDFSRRGVY